MAYQIVNTEVFDKWAASLRDRRAAGAIAKRLTRVVGGNFGDAASVGHGVSELKINIGQGYRVYYTIRRQTVVILLCGGDKSTQDKDIKRAKKLAKEA